MLVIIRLRLCSVRAPSSGDSISSGCLVIWAKTAPTVSFLNNRILRKISQEQFAYRGFLIYPFDCFGQERSNAQHSYLLAHGGISL